MFSPKTETELLNILKVNLEQYPFVRLCTMSPKDQCNSCLFSDSRIAYETLKRSERTINLWNEHLFLRELRNFKWEARCFWSHDKLTAVSMPYQFDDEEKERIIQFFEKWKLEIPYHSAVIDIGLYLNDIEIIEFNSLGLI